MRRLLFFTVRIGIRNHCRGWCCCSFCHFKFFSSSPFFIMWHPFYVALFRNEFICFSFFFTFVFILCKCMPWQMVWLLVKTSRWTRPTFSRKEKLSLKKKRTKGNIKTQTLPHRWLTPWKQQRPVQRCERENTRKCVWLCKFIEKSFENESGNVRH